MCGIAGYIGKEKLTDKQINDTLKMMYQRGPDFQSYNEYVFDELVVYLFHTRLSILDLNERSNQPFALGDYVIIYNGEIYNYIELRTSLQKKAFHS